MSAVRSPSAPSVDDQMNPQSLPWLASPTDRSRLDLSERSHDCGALRAIALFNDIFTQGSNYPSNPSPKSPIVPVEKAECGKK